MKSFLTWIFLVIIGSTQANSIDNCNKLYQERSFESAYFNCLPLAEHGNSDAQTIIGSMYLGYEALIYPDVVLSIREDLSSVNIAITNSRIQLTSVQSDESYGVFWYNKAVKNNNAKAAFLLGLYQFKDNPDLAAKLLTKAAQQDYPPAQLALYSYYYNKNDITTAITWINKYIKATNSSAMEYELGMLYLATAVNLKLNPAQALANNKKSVYWLTEAAKDNFSAAQFALAECYRTGKIGTPDQGTYVYWLTKSAQMGYPIAIRQLGEKYYFDGNYESAFHFTQIAADMHYDSASYLLAKMYLDGNGIAVNESRGLEYLQEAAKNGFPSAQSLLGSILLTGDYGMSKNVIQGLQYTESAALNGSVGAQIALGNIYASRGDIIGEKNLNIDTARKWYEMAADSGNVSAQAMTCASYATPDVENKTDYSRAMYWCQKAASNGDENVKLIVIPKLEALMLANQGK